MAQLYHDRIFGSVSERRKKLGNSDIRKGERYAASWIKQVMFLFLRSFRATLRDPLLLKVRLAQTLMVALAVGCVYWQVKLNKDTILTVNGFLFNCVRDNFFMLVFPCLTVFADEMPVFLRENHANIYRTDAYFFAKNLAELPQYIIIPTIYSIIVFFMTGILSGVGQFFVFLAANIVVTNVAVSVAYAAACLFGTVDIASQILPLITLPIMCMGGFFVNLNHVSKALGWLKYISWHRFSFEIHMINQWEHNQNSTIESCDAESDGNCDWGYNGFEILDFFGFSNDWNMILRNFAILLFTILILRGIAVSALFVRVRFVR